MKRLTADFAVSFYRFWHGRLHLKGAGWLIRKLLPFNPILQNYAIRLPEGQSIVLDFRDVSSSYWMNHLAGDPFEEHGLATAVLRCINKDSIVWDVGANCGLFSYHLCRNNAPRRLYFFEPNPKMFGIASSALLPFHTIGLQFALSDKEGTATLTIPSGGSTNATLEAVKIQLSGETQVIECRRGDDLIAAGELETPDVIKIDTEGHECAVLSGLSNTLDKCRTVVFFEHISMTDEDLEGVIPGGYELYSVSDVDGTLSMGLDRARGHNSVLIPKSFS